MSYRCSSGFVLVVGEKCLEVRSDGLPRAHWIKVIGLLAPLIIGEVVKDPQKRWRYIRLVSLVATAASEVSWQKRVGRERAEMADCVER